MTVYFICLVRSEANSEQKNDLCHFHLLFFTSLHQSIFLIVLSPFFGSQSIINTYLYDISTFCAFIRLEFEFVLCCHFDQWIVELLIAHLIFVSCHLKQRFLTKLLDSLLCVLVFVPTSSKNTSRYFYRGNPAGEPTINREMEKSWPQLHLSCGLHGVLLEIYRKKQLQREVMSVAENEFTPALKSVQKS